MKIIYTAYRDTNGPMVHAFIEGPKGMNMVGKIIDWESTVDEKWVEDGYDRFKVEETMTELLEEQR